MKKEIKERLDKYKSYLESAYYCDYTRQLTRNDLNELISIYEEHLNSRFTENVNCGICVLNLLKRLGQDYFNYEEPINIEENASTITIEEQTKGQGIKKTKSSNSKKLPA